MRANFLAATTLLATVASAAPFNSSSPPADEATRFSLIYGFPLIPFAKSAGDTLSIANATNKYYHMREIAGPLDQTIVRPNVDTLYSAAVIDLSHSDIVIDIPSIDNDRYWIYPFYDLYANNFANIGSTTNGTAGKYLVRYDPSKSKEIGVHLCSHIADRGADEGCDGYDGYINAPTPYGQLIARFEAMNNSTDFDTIHQLQNKSTIHLATRSRLGDATAPQLGPNMLNSSTYSGDIPTRIMQMLARFAPHNPPRNISDLPRVNRMLKTAGIDKGHYKSQVRNLTTVAQTAAQKVGVAFNQPQNVMNLTHDWQMIAPAAQGEYNTNYYMRAFMANWGYLALTAQESLYPMYAGDGDTLKLGADEAYIFTFSGKPPVMKQGFWSLTAYNAQKYLIENTQDQYSVSDRSGLTYSDGTPVYGDDAGKQTQFQVLVQPADKEPPKNWTSNWLPAPAGGGQFDLTLRFYAPEDELKNGSWEFPVVQKHKAITE
ncbi:unnamed protein product [Penicillium salamii]|uniref:DUF1254 domain-containing protein n=1 Tax=Penicillium salamii TaxID=1612424 RepID=A0A9W4ITM4_9EURO|nr:unnamed protein product [Penicillium salamii]CAG8018772.1 unnamed protein product [Penicillium salamii]CAG8126202.1 unnamed protein product [Penicillium salamii]CAG8306708.1 unnamed protein product [Penicillium salamii]CAG8319266.1 unnamed protein product [Penicillium salamii]